MTAVIHHLWVPTLLLQRETNLNITRFQQFALTTNINKYNNNNNDDNNNKNNNINNSEKEHYGSRTARGMHSHNQLRGRG